MTKEEVDRLFKKEAGSEQTNREIVEFPNNAVAQVKRWKEGRRNESAGARLEAREVQNHLDNKFRREYLEVVKQGVLEGKIEIHETDYGFMIDTPEDKVKEFVQNHPKFQAMQSAPDDLRRGWFLIGTVTDLDKERVNLVRKSLIDEFHAENPSDLMLVDLAVSNYVRAMYATQTEMESIRYADNYRMEMYEIMMEGIQPYIHSCQNQLLRVLTALRAGRQSSSRSTFTHETYSRTKINLENWGLPLLLGLAEITQSKEQDIDIDEIKVAMAKYAKGVNAQNIPNHLIGYVLRDFGFTEKVHVREGNHYNIERGKVLTLLDEGLKP
ncbi:MAG: hypothetical protein ACLPY5_14180 [Candidatus Bathyarchaeia archaeon]